MVIFFGFTFGFLTFKWANEYEKNICLMFRSRTFDLFLKDFRSSFQIIIEKVEIK